MGRVDDGRWAAVHPFTSPIPALPTSPRSVAHLVLNPPPLPALGRSPSSSLPLLGLRPPLHTTNPPSLATSDPPSLSPPHHSIRITALAVAIGIAAPAAPPFFISDKAFA
ncbi:hypothetical protein PANT_14c00085 [Moesziomyces antarcticus T-34]|uniref:Uncharacterized protein n=1 Tax=Pseudozyma antarctica (strain T-34) TaxID=1151754 RepID=M9MGG2_PSEA3|nr:hypothetical protein PANT_14c00085 [Moesziomyces antarcticus T-34]